MVALLSVGVAPSVVFIVMRNVFVDFSCFHQASCRKSVLLSIRLNQCIISTLLLFLIDVNILNNVRLMGSNSWEFFCRLHLFLHAEFAGFCIGV